MPACVALLADRPGAAAAALAISLLLLGSGSADAQSPAAASRADVESPVVPVHHEPHHRQVFQYGRTRVLDLQLPPGDVSWFHSPEWPVLYMTLGQSPIRNQNLGSEWSGGNRPARAAGGNLPAGDAGRSGPAGDTPPARRVPRATSATGYIERPSTHRIENVGEGLFRAMVVVNESAGNDATTVEEAGFDSEPELANAWFRSYRVSLAAGETTAAHEHTTPVVIFQATEGRGRAEGPMSFEFNEPGQWAFYDAGTGHTIVNTGEAPLEWLEIEVRHAPPSAPQP